ncbi:two component system sensor histidine kinase [Desulfosarcina variabilis str. Montpellier]|uniref:PAS domain S-box protein n=1 Tax=Desulfosarcina variabilis TaxID=2300 RepID=UPI003AFAEE36
MKIAASIEDEKSIKNLSYKKDVLKTIIITIGSISLSMMITLILCTIWGENQAIRINYTLLISFIAPLIITPIVCVFFINLNNKLKKTEQLLKDEIHWRSLLAEESGDAIVVIDENAKVAAANTQFADMLGYSKKEVHQLHVWDWDVQLNQRQIMELAKDVGFVGHHFETQHRCKNGRIIDVELSNNGATYRGKKLILCICRDITDRKKAESEKNAIINKLEKALAEVKTLRGFIPICANCKNIRNDNGYWQQVEQYVQDRSDAQFSHSLCPKCAKELYPDMNITSDP